MAKAPIMIVGVMEEKHVGGQLRKAAEVLGLEARCMDATEAYSGNGLLRKIAWHFGRRPIGLSKFSALVLAGVKEVKPSVVLTTGQAPLDEAVLRGLGEMGIFRVNYSTDDPWNPAHRAGWFLKALKQYDRVFSTRKANLGQFSGIGVKAEHLPFGYDPDLYFPDAGLAPLNLPPPSPATSSTMEKTSASADGFRRPDSGGEKEEVFLAGGGDEDRYQLVKALHEAGIQMSLWGGYWERAGLKSHGFLDAAGIRREASRCAVSLLLVRRANRDGSAMRSFEIPACGGCCVAEDTEEHREMFGPDGEAVLYFRTPEELVRRVKEAFADPALRQRLRKNAHQAITEKPNTYVDRLKTILERVEEKIRIGDRE
jgi:glycosyltransferase involved in cell wall biosynthesis